MPRAQNVDVLSQHTRRLLKSRRNRILLVVFFAALCASATFHYGRLDIEDSPRSFRWKTAMTFYPGVPASIEKDWQDTLKDVGTIRDECDLGNVERKFRSENPSFSNATATVGAQYREIYLCNAAGLGGDTFSAAHRQFKLQVDEAYRDYYFSIGGRVVASIVGGLLMSGFLVAAIVGSMALGNWINRGESGHAD